MSYLQSYPDSSVVPTVAEHCRFECVSSRGSPDAAWVRVGGELDIASAPRLRRALCEALAGARLVVVDLRELEFMDCTGVHLLIEADARARRGGQRVVFVRGSAQVDRLFDLVGISGRLEIVDLTAMAVAARALESSAPADAA